MTTDSELFAQLLERFNSGGDREQSFQNIVEQFGGLVLSSASRRTGDVHLAEEITQNVFSTLARKAHSLVNHPAPVAWLFKVTGNEAARAVRARRRRHRKHEALAQETKITREPTPESALDHALDRLPQKDRELLIARFYEGRSFAEIASAFGKTPAACKMQQKRALEKLSRYLGKKDPPATSVFVKSILVPTTSDDATLSGIVLPSPAPRWLDGFGFQAKPFFISAATVVAVAQIPYSIQAHRLEITKPLEPKHAHQVAPVTTGTKSTLPTQQAISKIVRNLESLPTGPFDIHSVMTTLIEAEAIGDLRTQLAIRTRFARLDAPSHLEMIRRLGEYRGTEHYREWAAQLLSFNHSKMAAVTPLEEFIASGLPAYTYSSIIEQWAKSDLNEAHAWFCNERKKGTFEKTAERAQAEKSILGIITSEFALHSPNYALDLFDSEQGTEIREQIVWGMAQNFSKRLESDPEDLFLDQMFTQLRTSREFGRAIEGAIADYNRVADRSRALTIIETYAPDQTIKNRAILDLAGYVWDTPREEAADWLLETLSPKDSLSIVPSFVKSRANKLDQWAFALPAGALRDACIKVLPRDLR